LRKLETRRDEAWRSYDEASREIDRQKDALLDKIKPESATENGTGIALHLTVVPRVTSVACAMRTTYGLSVPEHMLGAEEFITEQSLTS